MEINPLWILVCVGIPLFGVIIFAWGLRSERKQSAKKIEETRSQYQDALSKLKKSPGNKDALQETVRLGKTYADLVQFDKRDPFNKVTLLHDLNAARSGLPPLTSINEAGSELSSSPVEQQLTELEELHEKGLITKTEYHEKRLQVFDQL